MMEQASKVENLVETAAAAMALPLVVLDEAGRAIDANDAFLEIARLTAPQLSGLSISALFVTHPSGLVEPLIKVLSRAGAPQRGEACLRRSDGRVLDVSYTVGSFMAGGQSLRALTVADVTAEKCLNCKIHISREKYRRVVDDQAELLCRLLPDLTVTFANESFAACFGLLPREIVGLRLDDLLGDSAMTGLKQWVDALTPEDFLSDGLLDLDLPGRDGRPTWWRRRAIFEPGGDLLAVQLVGRDGPMPATAVAQTSGLGLAADALARLRDSEDRHRGIISTLEEGVILVDRTGIILQVNRAAERILDITEGAIGQPIAKLLDRPVIDRSGRPRDRRGLPMDVALRYGKAVGGEILGIRLAKDTIWLRVNAQPILLPGHEGACGLLSFTDVTDLVLAQDQLEDNKQRLRAILDHTFEFIGLLDVQGTVLDINRTALDFVGVTIEDVRGKPFWDTPWWRHDVAAQQLLRDAVTRAGTGAFVRFEADHLDAEGDPITIDFSLSPMADADGKVFMLIPEGRDITERKLSEQHLEQARLEAETANATKTHFLANMSHELRTPLNAVMGYAEAILSEMFGPLENERYREYLGIIHASGGHLLDIIGDILEISRIELGELELTLSDVALTPLIGEVGALLGTRAAEAGVRLRTEIDPGLKTWPCDRRRVLQMLLNLGSNGIKFTPSGGTVTLSLHVEPSNAGEILCITVSDTGIGIPAEHQEVVWQSFRQVAGPMTRCHDGLGLGLPIVRHLVEAHGGTIGMTSVVGRGTTVVARLPRVVMQ